MAFLTSLEIVNECNGPYVEPKQRAGTDRQATIIQIVVAPLSVPAGSFRNDLDRPPIEITQFSGLFFASKRV